MLEVPVLHESSEGLLLVFVSWSCPPPPCPQAGGSVDVVVVVSVSPNESLGFDNGNDGVMDSRGVGQLLLLMFAAAAAAAFSQPSLQREVMTVVGGLVFSIVVSQTVDMVTSGITDFSSSCCGLTSWGCVSSLPSSRCC